MEKPSLGMEPRAGSVIGDSDLRTKVPQSLECGQLGRVRVRGGQQAERAPCVDVSTQQVEHRPNTRLAYKGHQHVNAVGRRHFRVELEADTRLARSIGEKRRIEERGCRERYSLGFAIGP